MSQPEPLTRLVEHLQRLPGIGRKSAQRLAFHVLKTPRAQADLLCEAIRDVFSNTHETNKTTQP